MEKIITHTTDSLKLFVDITGFYDAVQNLFSSTIKLNHFLITQILYLNNTTAIMIKMYVNENKL